MAMIACDECDHRISNRAVTCPNCGAPVAGRPPWRRPQVVSGVLLTVAVLLVVAVGAPILWTRVTGRQAVSLNGMFPTAGSSAASPTSTTSRDDERNSPHPIYQTTADQLYQDYNSNGVATQTRIGEGGVRVSGTVAAIEEDAAGHAVIKLSTHQAASSADMTLTADQTAAAAQLTKGQTVDIQCSSMRGIGGLPVGSQCALVVVTAASVIPPSTGLSTGSPASVAPPPVVSHSSELGARSKSARTRGQPVHAARPTPAPADAPPPAAIAAQPAVESAPIPEPVPVAPVSPAPAQPANAVETHAAPPGVAAPVQPPAANASSPPAVASAEIPPTTPPAVPDDLASVRATDPQAADHIAAYCAQSIGAVNGDAYAAGCRRDEQAAWTRLVRNQEFASLDDATRRKCSEPPFPDSYTAKESCARYLLSKTNASAQR